MAEVQAQPRPHKQKVGTLDGFLAGNASSTHNAREEKTRNEHKKEAKNGTTTTKDASAAAPAQNVGEDGAVDAVVPAVKKDQLESTSNHGASTKRVKPRHVSGKDPLSQSLHIPRPSALSDKDRSSSQPLSKSKNRSAIPRSQSFHKKDVTTGSNGNTKVKDRRKSNAIPRSKSFDGGEGPLKRIPRNPQRNALDVSTTSAGSKPCFPKNAPRRGSSDLSVEGGGEKKKRPSATGATLERQGSKRNSMADAKQQQSSQKKLGEKQSSQKKMGEKQSSQKKMGEKQSSQNRVRRTPSNKEKPSIDSKDNNAKSATTTTKAPKRTKSGSKAKQSSTAETKKPNAEAGSQAFSADVAEGGDEKACGAPFQASFDNVMAPLNQNVSDNENDDDDDDDDTYREDDAAPVGIMQFDPSAMDNVKICRGDSIDEFPSDMGCPVDMGLGDILLGEEEEQNAQDETATRRGADGNNRGRSTSPYRNNGDDPQDADADKKAGRWGLGFRNFKIKKSNSFKFSKSGHNQDDEEQTTTMSTVAMRLMGISPTGHQQLGGDGMDDSLFDN
ncbi:expressed unknown protein [Seminavis robusta]|uniref:Uncharacterized protein n=1 Tax=Seminavis robusta TaxID=568900 RepID=A0A9N8HMS9_9STRA|nr:expressed unknown protein [Seminavis robusta]|eukprot:Sro1024_g232670.1 n/a (557) ;mRNA; f:22479-24149